MARRKSVVDVKDVINRLRKVQSIREIHRETKIHRKIIREIKDLAVKNEWLNPEKPLPADMEINKFWNNPGASSKKNHPLDNFSNELENYLKSGYSYVVMHSLIRDRYSCDESTVRRYVKRQFPAIVKPVMVRKTIPGEIMEVDFGYLGLTFDQILKRNRKTYIFSGRLRHSRKAYREIVFNQKGETFWQCHIHAFEYFDGVPQKVVPDNLKAAVIKASFQDPILNRSYRSLAEHYDFLISPCLPYHPRHKGGVENDIKYVKKNFWPIFKENQKRKGRTYYCADELAKELEEWNENVSEKRTIQGVGKTPPELFESDEKKALNPLPPFRWSGEVWKECKAARDCRIQFNKAFYSIPYKYIGNQVMVCSNNLIIRIFYNHQEIASHPKAKRDWEFIYNEKHFPPNQQEYLSTTRQGILQKASFIGKNTRILLEKLFDEEVLDALRPARGILQLGKKYSNRRLESACERALEYNTPSYRSVKNILVKELDTISEKQESLFPNLSKPIYRFARGIGFFK